MNFQLVGLYKLLYSVKFCIDKLCKSLYVYLVISLTLKLFRT